jgi:hypothetical protein
VEVLENLAIRVLRVLTVIACCLLIPYFYSQPTPLMVPIYWQIIFVGVNLVQIGILIHERRPIQLAASAAVPKCAWTASRWRRCVNGSSSAR